MSVLLSGCHSDLFNFKTKNKEDWPPQIPYQSSIHPSHLLKGVFIFTWDKTQLSLSPPNSQWYLSFLLRWALVFFFFWALWWKNLLTFPSSFSLGRTTDGINSISVAELRPWAGIKSQALGSVQHSVSAQSILSTRQRPPGKVAKWGEDPGWPWWASRPHTPTPMKWIHAPPVNIC